MEASYPWGHTVRNKVEWDAGAEISFVQDRHEGRSLRVSS